MPDLMPETITVEIPYTMDSGEKLVNETFGPNNIRRSRTGSDDRKRMTIRTAGCSAIGCRWMSKVLSLLHT